jgi:hypothetical protein
MAATMSVLVESSMMRYGFNGGQFEKWRFKGISGWIPRIQRCRVINGAGGLYRLPPIDQVVVVVQSVASLQHLQL